MKKALRWAASFALLLTASFAAKGQSDLVLSAVYDGPLPGGQPKGVEIYVLNNIADLSIYGIGSANNGGGTDGEEFTFPAVSANAGDYIYVTSDSADFVAYLGFTADYEDGSMSINGDDAVELFMNGSVVDVFGDINTDGTGQPWDFLDGWAYRVDNTGPDDSTFVLANWTFSGANALDGCSDNMTCSSIIPIGTYFVGAVVPTLEFAAAGMTVNEDAGTVDFMVNLSDTDAAMITAEVSLDLVASTTDASDYSAFTSPQTITFMPGTSGDQMVSITITDDMMVEPLETIVFNLGNLTGNVNLGTDSVYTLTVMDNDVPTFSFEDTLISITEDDTILMVQVNIENPATTPAEVMVQFAASTAANGVDYTFSDTTIVFPANDNTPAMIPVTIIEDMLVENDENIELELIALNGTGVLGLDSTLTIVILDDDFDVLPIGTINTVDADGVADSSGVAVVIEGTVHGLDTRLGNGLGFTLIDGTGGINALNFADNFGYTPVEGDSLQVHGTVGQFNGLTQIVMDTLIFISGGAAIQAPTPVTVLDEATESNIASLENVWIIDPSDWSNSGSGFNVDVTNGTDTFAIRIDDATDLYNLDAPTGMFTVCGIGGQFDNSSPFLSGYQLLPRYSADIKFNVDLGADTTVCGLIDLEAGFPGSYVWSNADTTNSIEVTTDGTYYVTVTYGNSVASDTIDVIVLDAPVAAFSVDGDTTNGGSFFCFNFGPVEFTDMSTGATSWNWAFGDGNTSTLQNPSNTYANGGTFEATLVVSNGTCVDSTSFDVVGELCLSVEEFELGAVELYPTLTDGNLTLNLDLEASQNIELSVIDLSGRTVWTEGLGNVQTATHQIQLDVAKGTYLLRIAGNGKYSTKKFFVR